ncbi:MAG TPA: UDP-3-O-(3-hydroxymyristoyl)glucosamine N-acyltransferase [Rhizomicrobium sp.]|nr:UDP-3-O-(3-hydroxymyristoyl)glucosamine N-acyltransferase [Rhizomicrobium sp.]
MADPRFYKNRGPFALADVCARVGASSNGDPAALLHDLATLEGAGPDHLTFCVTKSAAGALAKSQAGFCLVDKTTDGVDVPARMVLLACRSALETYAAVAQMFYPAHGAIEWPTEAIHKSARIGTDVTLAPGVVVGAGAEVGDRTRIGPNTVIGPGVAIGRDCELGANVTITHTLVGDQVQVLAGAQIGQPGFGFASGAMGHAKIPQLGRVIIQDAVEIGACTTIDRGALGDTVIGEGTKIDNLVQIGHNTRTGRHCIIVAQAGVAGSCELGDFVVLGGQVGVADHARLGDGARVAAKSGVPPGEYPGRMDYGGYPVRTARDWRRETAALVLLAKRRKQDRDG